MPIPFIGLLITRGDPPPWLQIAGVVAIVLLVGASSVLLRRRALGWRPTETLNQPREDAD